MATDKRRQTPGREANAATPLTDETDTSVTPERYPPTDKHDAAQAPANPQPRQGAGDGGPERGR